jgi:hypothetical protein
MTRRASRRRSSRKLHRNAGYAPDPTAPDAGEWDRTQDPILWRQSHLGLLHAALSQWLGEPSTMQLAIRDLTEGVSLKGTSANAKWRRAQAAALLWELERRSRVCPHPLYRGARTEPRGIESWSELRSVANRFAKQSGGRVYELRDGRGLRVRDYLDRDFADEREWIVAT